MYNEIQTHRELGRLLRLGRYQASVKGRAHEYTVKHDWDVWRFEEAVQMIKDHGNLEGTRFVYPANGFEYTVEDIQTHKTYVIKRHKKEYRSVYSDFVRQYLHAMDCTGPKRTAREEASNVLPQVQGRTLEIGVGSGQSLAHQWSLSPMGYTGVEICPELADYAKARHRGYHVINCSLEHLTDYGFKTIFALGGTASYLTDNDTQRVFDLLAPGGTAYLSYYLVGRTGWAEMFGHGAPLKKIDPREVLEESLFGVWGDYAVLTIKKP